MKGKGKIKTGAMGMIACLTLSTLTGCSMQPVVDEEGEATITIWHDKEDAVTQVLEDALSELEPEIHVVLEKRGTMLLYKAIMSTFGFFLHIGIKLFCSRRHLLITHIPSVVHKQ